MLPTGVPFVYYSDFDPHGLHQFTLLKYGCRRTAWASQMCTCPRLTWQTPTGQQLYYHHEHYIKEVARSDNAKRTSMTIEELDQRAEE